MAVCENSAAEGVIRWDIDTTLVGEDAGFDLPVSEAGVEGERNIFVHGLECLQDKWVSGRSQLNSVGEGSANEIDEKGRWEEGDLVVVGVIRGEKVRSAREGVGAGK